MSRTQAGLSLVEGRIAQQAAREFAAAGARATVEGLARPISAVKYADGTYRTIGDYGDMLLRTKTAQAYVAGTLNQATALGTQYFEIADGTECGLASHDDREKPNGKVYPAEIAYSYPLAHPRCRRDFLPRPDITSQAQAEGAEPSTTAAQREDQYRAERERAARFERRRRRVVRAGRQPRAPRRPRTPTPTASMGRPVSQALDVHVGDELGERVGHGIQVIDRVHKDGKLPMVPVQRSQSTKELGAFGIHRHTRQPAYIKVSRYSDHPDLTTVHEVGHFLDHNGIGTPGGFSSDLAATAPELPEIGEWWRAVEGSDSYNKFLHLLTVNEPGVDHKSIREYWLDPAELWARSYAQYIATRSGDRVLLTQLRAMQERQTANDLAYPSQWSHEDFHPIINAMDKLFRKLGWLK